MRLSQLAGGVILMTGFSFGMAWIETTFARAAYYALAQAAVLAVMALGAWLLFREET